MKNIVKMVVFGALISSSASALEIYSGDTMTASITGRIVVSSNSDDRNISSISGFRNAFDNGSRIGFTFINTEIEDLRVKGFFEWGINTQELSNSGTSFITNREGYIEFSNDELGNIRVGKFWSLLATNTVGMITDNLQVGALTAGFNHGNGELAGIPTGRADEAIAYYTTFDNNIGVGIQFQGKREGLTVKNNALRSFESQTILNGGAGKDSLINRDWALSTYVNYVGDVIQLTTGYIRVNNYIAKDAERQVDDIATDILLTNNMINVDIAVLGMGARLGDFYMGTTGVYQKNALIAGVEHFGGAVYAEYSLGKIVPYVGYQYVVSPNVLKTKASDGTPLYGSVATNKSVIEESELSFGVAYYASRSLRFVIEHTQDLRSDEQLERSLLRGNTAQTYTTIMVRYDFR